MRSERNLRLFTAILAVACGTAAAAADRAALHSVMEDLTRAGEFSGAIVVRNTSGVHFARGYGAADPFNGRPFTPDTAVDSGSIAKPVTAAAVLLLAKDGKVDLDAPVQRYLHEFPHASATVHHLLAHSAGLPLEESADALSGKTNAALLAEVAGRAPLFPPGRAFTYCNLCYITLAMLIERVSGQHYLEFVRRRVLLPQDVALRPARLADWNGRAIGYRRIAQDHLERFDSWEGETFFGSGNFSISAAQLAQWGSEWWNPTLSAIRRKATLPALVAGRPSGLSWGNWYCAPNRRRCHYLGHHEGFHHMLYWDADRRISLAMVTNNGLSPALHQRLQRALVAFAENRHRDAEREIQARLPSGEAPTGRFRLRGGELITLTKAGGRVSVERRGVSYPAYPTGSLIRYVPGLDAYIAGDQRGRLHWITLYEEFVGLPE
jgi:CubicO group peptidase (beta-lactamase class C family)